MSTELGARCSRGLYAGLLFDKSAALVLLVCVPIESQSLEITLAISVEDGNGDTAATFGV